MEGPNCAPATESAIPDEPAQSTVLAWDRLPGINALDTRKKPEVEELWDRLPEINALDTMEEMGGEELEALVNLLLS